MSYAHHLLQDLVDALSNTGLSGHRVENGADFIRCPSCLATKDIKGFASSSYGIEEIEHDGGCELYDAYVDARKMLDGED